MNARRFFAGALLTTLAGHKKLIQGAIALDSGARALSWSSDATLKVWDTATGDVLIGVPRYAGSTDFTLATTATIPFQTAAKFSLPYLATQIVVAMA